VVDSRQGATLFATEIVLIRIFHRALYFILV